MTLSATRNAVRNMTTMKLTLTASLPGLVPAVLAATADFILLTVPAEILSDRVFPAAGVQE